MNRRGFFSSLLGALAVPFVGAKAVGRIKYLTRDETRGMDAPFPPEHTTGYVQCLSTSQWSTPLTATTTTAGNDVDVQWRFFINASEQTSLAFQRDEPDLYEPQEEVPSRN
jgi:hypothetical protein